MLFSILYISQAKNSLSPEELLPLLEQLKKWNEEHSITGRMIYVQGIYKTHIEGRFIQVLEGHEQEVRKVFEQKVVADNNQVNIIPLRQQKIKVRSFSTWEAGFESISLEQNKELKVFFELNEEVLKSEAFNDSEALINFMKSFPAVQLNINRLLN